MTDPRVEAGCWGCGGSGTIPEIAPTTVPGMAAAVESRPCPMCVLRGERDEARAMLRDLLAWVEHSPQNRRATTGALCNRPWPVGRAQKFTETLEGGDD